MTQPAPATDVVQLGDRLADATVAAARAVAPLVGRGAPEAVDRAAVEALRRALAALPAAAIVVASEGAKDRAPMLAIGERVGPRAPAPIGFDLAVDPVDGTRAAAAGRAGAIVAVAAAARGSLRAVTGAYLEQLAVGPRAADAIAMGAPVAENLGRVAAALGVPVARVRVAILARDRNRALRDAARAAGSEVQELADADLAAMIGVGLGRDVDVVLGISGAPETVLAACGLRGLGGRVVARDPAGGPWLDTADLAGGPTVVLAATGVTATPILAAVSGERTHTRILATGAAPRERWD